MIYFWLNSPAMAVDQVARRVGQGGHNIPEEVLRRRYQHGAALLMQLFIGLVDKWLIYDNSNDMQEIIAEMNLEKNTEIYSPNKWQQLKTISNGF